MKTMLTEFYETGNPHRLSLCAILGVLMNEKRIIDWDDAWDTLDQLDSSYREELPELWDVVSNTEANYTARAFCIQAISLVDPGLLRSALVLSAILNDSDSQLRSDAAKSLSACNQEVVSKVISPLAIAAKDWRSTINAQLASFQALTTLIGLRETVVALQRTK